MKSIRNFFISIATLVSLSCALTQAQELEPRAYINTPVGLNFLLAAYAKSEGGLSTDPALPVDDAELNIDTVIAAYVRSLDLWGNSGKVDVIVPYSDLDGSALVAGQYLERFTRGYGDPRLRLSYNFYGAPALSPQEFAKFKQDWVVGTSIQITAPLGEYDPDRLINLGTNHWSIKPDIGFSKVLGKFIVDFTAGVTIYADNDDFYGGQHRELEPIYSMQSNVSYNFGGGMWTALGYTYYKGGRTTIDGVINNDGMSNSRVGFLFAYPINQRQSLKFNISNGVTTRVGTSFKTFGIAWQYRWGGGI